MLVLALEGRKRVKEQILKIDETFAPVTFSYTDRADGRFTKSSHLKRFRIPPWPERVLTRKPSKKFSARQTFPLATARTK